MAMIPEIDPDAIDYFVRISMAQLDRHARDDPDPETLRMWRNVRPHAEKLVRAHVHKEIAKCIAQHEARDATIN
jgi:hypothetical protein